MQLIFSSPVMMAERQMMYFIKSFVKSAIIGNVAF